MFLGEANLEVPDNEMASLKRVVASAARIGRLPKDAEKWIKDVGPKARRASDAAPPVPTKAAPAHGPMPVAPDSRSGRIVPATNRFRQPDPVAQDDDGEDSTPAAAPSKPAPKAKPEGPGLMKRAFSALRRRDPENNLPIPKSANTKVPGKPGKASLPDLGRFFNTDSAQGSHAASVDDPLADYPNKAPQPAHDIDVDSEPAPYKSPFASLGTQDADEDDDDPVIKKVTTAFSSAKKKEKAPEANDDFEGDEKTDVDVKPAPKAKAQHPSKSGGKERKKESLTLLRQMVVDRNHRRH